jgi:hypothetical protein
MASNTCKFFIQKIVFFISLLVTLLGALSAIFGVLSMNLIDVSVPEKIQDLGVDANGLGIAIIIVGATAFLIGALGLLSAKCMKPIFTVPFCCLGLIVGFTMLFVGLAGTGLT